MLHLTSCAPLDPPTARLTRALAALSEVRNATLERFPGAVEFKVHGIERDISAIEAKLRGGLNAVEREATHCLAYPLNGCAHPQFCKSGCTGRPLRDGDWDALKRDIEAAWVKPLTD